ncbi:ABC transporter ATP-binding protein [Xanthobacter sediminis]|uniref:ABC transporter ATP-binding protein n=1 Tax=Xanthobacter sediminis TaxID=3119926 RepID=UPI0037283F60
MAATALEIRNLSKTYVVNGAPLPVLAGISLDVAPGEFVSVVGASGCGKSTLLRLIVGLESEHEGHLGFAGRAIRGPGPERAIVFQEHRLFPWLTAAQNVEAGLARSDLGKAERRRIASEHLALVGLSKFAQALPKQLSGGMAQRVAIARALVSRPGLLLLDEPFGALDALTRSHLQREVLRIVRQEGLSAIIVTHDVDEAILLGDRVVVMQPHPGRIAEIIDIPEGPVREPGTAEAVALRKRILRRLGED